MKYWILNRILIVFKASQLNGGAPCGPPLLQWVLKSIRFVFLKIYTAY